jgi:hypothetical protein
MKRIHALALLILIAALPGCSRTATVGGHVRYKGRPVLSGSVIVLNADGTAESGVIYPDGTYTVKGVKKGPVRLGVFSPDPAKAHSILKTADKDHHAGPGNSPGWFPIPADFGNPEKSGLGCEVTTSRFPFDIEMN